MKASNFLEISQTLLDEEPVVHTKSLLQRKVHSCRDYMSINDIYQTLRMSYRWKYVHVDIIWGLTTYITHWVLHVKVCTCRHHLRINGIFQTLKVPYSCKNVDFESVWVSTISTCHCHQPVYSTRIQSASLRVPFQATCMYACPTQTHPSLGTGHFP
jgi:hypothetical protein